MTPRGRSLPIWRAFACLAVTFAPAAVEGLARAVNPVRKVVNLLQKMQEQVKAEGEKSLKEFDKYMCYCQTTGAELAQSIEEGKTRIDALTSSVKSTGEELESTKQDCEKHKASREEAKGALQEATEIRNKEAADFAAESSELKANIEALRKAILALTKGMEGSFLQSSEAAKLHKFILDMANIEDTSRKEVLDFLQGGSDQEYSPSSGEINGVLKQIKDRMTTTLAEITADENSAIKEFNFLEAAKKKEIEALTAQIEQEMLRIGELGVEHATMKNELEDTEQQLKEDYKFQAELMASCNAKKKEYEALKKSFGDELIALGEAIKLINSDDARELFGKTLSFQQGSVSFLQVRVKARRAHALAEVRKAKRRHGGTAHGRPELDLVALALHGKQQGFEKVKWMIDRMIRNLAKEQQDDDEKKAYCEKQLDLGEDKKKALELDISDTQAAIDELKGTLAELKEETKALAASIKALDKSVDEATAMRKEDHAAYDQLIAEDSTAKELLVMAKNRLNQFYNPNVAKAAVLSQEKEAQEELQEDEVEDAPPSFVQVKARGAAPKQDSAGVLTLMDMIIRDLEKEMWTAETNEKDAQGDYEKMMEEAASKRATDAKALTERESATAETQEALEMQKGAMSESMTELHGQNEYIADLHGECDWLLKYYSVRKEGRADETDALEQAKAVLSGADYDA